MKKYPFLILLALLSFSNAFSIDNCEVIPGTNLAYDLSDDFLKYNSFLNTYYAKDNTCVVLILYEKVSLDLYLATKKNMFTGEKACIVDKESYLDVDKYLLVYHYSYNKFAKYYVLFAGNENGTSILMTEVREVSDGSDKSLDKILALYTECKISDMPIDVRRAMFFDVSLPEGYQLTQMNGNFFKFEDENKTHGEITFKGNMENPRMKLQDYLTVDKYHDDTIDESRPFLISSPHYDGWYTRGHDDEQNVRYKYAIKRDDYVLVIIVNVNKTTDPVFSDRIDTMIKEIKFKPYPSPSH